MKLFRRYVPFGAFIVALVLVLTFVPSIATTRGSSATGASGGSGTSGASVTLLPGQTAPALPGTFGITIGGVKCGPGVRQIPWSAYAPECIPAWHGSNGGATAPGVTGTTITLSYRMMATSTLNEIYSFLPPTVVGTNPEAITTLRAFVSVFNKYFELYGRHVVLKVFTGQGDTISEVTGQGQAKAEADAVTAKSLGAFADMALADSSPMYIGALANHNVIGFPLMYQQRNSDYLGEEPWIYTPGPDCTKTDMGLAAMVGNSLAGLDAVYAGDPSYHTKTRSFGVIYNDTPQSAQCYQLLGSDLGGYHVKPAVVAAYNFSLSNLVSSMTTVMEQMKSAGVTTILDPDEDPVTPGLFMSVAAADHYFPEWVMTSSFTGGNIDADAIQRRFSAEAPSEMSHVIEPGIVSTPAKTQEDYKAFEMGDRGGDPLPTYSLAWAYAPMMILYSALQGAGPDLTPQNFQAAFHKITSSASGGMFGPWTYGPGIADPSAGFQIVYWDPNATSNQDGLRGALKACNGGKMYTFADAGTQLPEHQQLSCFGA